MPLSLIQDLDVFTAVVNTTRDCMLVLDQGLHVRLVNKSFLDKFRLTNEEVVGRRIYDLMGGAWDIAEFRHLLDDVLPQNAAIEDFTVVHDFPRLGERHLLLNARTLMQNPGSPGLILLAFEDVTERYRAQREAQLSRELLAATVQSIADGVITTDADGNVLTLNPVAEQLTGWKQDEAIGCPLTQVFRIVNETTLAEVPNPALRALAAGTIMGLANHTLLIHKMGHNYAIADSAAPIRDLEGTIVGSVLVFRNVTAERESERVREALQQSQSALLASTAEGIYTVDQHGKCTLINNAALQLLGFEERECLGQDMHALVHRCYSDGSAFPESECEIFAVSQKNQALRECATFFWRNDGSRLPVNVSAAPIEIGGKFAGTVVAFSDRSEAERLEQRRNDTADRLRMAMDAARIITWTWEPLSGLLETSDNLEEILGVAAISDINTGVEMILPEDRAHHREQLRQAAEEQKNFRSEFRFRNPATGELVWLEGRVVCTKTGEPPVNTITGVLMDVTEKRRTLELLQETHQQLEQTAAELRRSNQDLNQFASVAGHDLQAPLRTMSVYSQLLKNQLQGNVDSKTESMLGFIIESARKMQQLITALLNYAQVDAEPRSDTEVELGGELKTILESLQSLIDESGTTIHSATLPVITGDLIQIRQLFQNLIVNAIKYREMGRRPEVRILFEDKPAHWKFCVADNGLGIDAQYLEVIFAPLRRLHGQDRPGTGLGLAVCRRIVANHGGELWAESVKGEGSRFYFTLAKRKTSFS